MRLQGSAAPWEFSERKAPTNPTAPSGIPKHSCSTPIPLTSTNPTLLTASAGHRSPRGRCRIVVPFVPLPPCLGGGRMGGEVRLSLPPASVPLVRGRVCGSVCLGVRSIVEGREEGYWQPLRCPPSHLRPLLGWMVPRGS